MFCNIWLPNSRFSAHTNELLLPVMLEGDREANCILLRDSAPAAPPSAGMLGSWEALPDPALWLYQFTQRSLKSTFRGRHSFYQMLTAFIARGDFLS